MVKLNNQTRFNAPYRNINDSVCFSDLKILFCMNKSKIGREIDILCVYIFLPLYSGGEVWEGIWNQTYFSVIEFLFREITPRYHILR